MMRQILSGAATSGATLSGCVPRFRAEQPGHPERPERIRTRGSANRKARLAGQKPCLGEPSARLWQATRSPAPPNGQSPAQGGSPAPPLSAGLRYLTHRFRFSPTAAWE